MTFMQLKTLNLISILNYVFCRYSEYMFYRVSLIIPKCFLDVLLTPVSHNTSLVGELIEVLNAEGKIDFKMDISWVLQFLVKM